MGKKPGKSQRRTEQPRAGTVFGAGAELVREAAVVLDQEMAIGMTAAKAVQQRLAQEHRIEPADFKDALQRFQTDAHDLVNSLTAQLTGDRLAPNVQLAEQFIARANDMIDLAVGIVTTSSELANQFIHTQLTQTNAGTSRTRRR